MMKRKAGDGQSLEESSGEDRDMTGWETKTLGEVVQIERGKFSHRPRNEPRFYGGNTPFVQTGDVTRSNGIVRTYTQTLNEDGVAISKVFPAGTILITIAANIGYAGILEFDSAAPDSLIGLTPNDTVSAEFLNFYLRTQQPEMDRMAPKGTQKNINIQFLKPWPVVVPPLPEQRKIAHVLSTVQRAIEAQERIIQTTTELKKALMHKLFTEGLRNESQKQTEIGPVPESWEVVTFDKFTTLQRGYDLRRQDFRDGEVPVIGATQIMGYHDTANVKAPGVTVVRSGSSAGKPLFIAEDFWAHNVLLYVKDFQGNVPKFVYYKILALDLTQYRQGVAVPTLNRNTFSSIELALPSPEEQQEIADALDTVGNKTEVAERKKTQLQDLFRTLLHELMTAKTRVNVAPLHA